MKGYYNILTPRSSISCMMYHPTGMCKPAQAVSPTTYAATARATGAHWQPLTNPLDLSSEDRSDGSLHLSCFWHWSAPQLWTCTDYVIGGCFQWSHTLCWSFCWQPPSHLLLHLGGSQLTWMRCQTTGRIKPCNFDLYTSKSSNLYPLCFLLGLHDLTTFLKLLFWKWSCYITTSNECAVPAKNSKQGPNPGACAHKPQAVRTFSWE